MKVLVTVASRHGSAAEIGRVVARILADAGIETDVREPASVETLDGYGGVILGSAIYMGRWLEAAREFVARFGPELRSLPVWSFSSGPLGDPAKPEGEPAEVVAMSAATGAIEHRMFAGRLVKSELGFGEKLVVAGVKAPYGDFRPWEDILAWGRGIADRMAEPAVGVGRS